MGRFKLVPDVHLILMEANKILMLRRYKTGYQDGKYSLVAGHADGNETLKSSIIREAKEEANIIVKPKYLSCVHVMHRFDDGERISTFFQAQKWEGDIKNNEPHKCDDLSWFSLGQIPDNTISYIFSALKHIRKGNFYSEFGWDNP